MTPGQKNELKGLALLNAALYGPWLAVTPVAWWLGGFEREFLAKLAPILIITSAVLLVIGFTIHWRRMDAS